MNKMRFLTQVGESPGPGESPNEQNAIPDTCFGWGAIPDTSGGGHKLC